MADGCDPGRLGEAGTGASPQALSTSPPTFFFFFLSPSLPFCSRASSRVVCLFVFIFHSNGQKKRVWRETAANDQIKIQYGEKYVQFVL